MLILLFVALPLASAYCHLARNDLVPRNVYSSNRLTAVTTRAEESVTSFVRPKVAVVLASDESVSTFRTKPFNGPVTWHEVMLQVAEKMRWEPINNPEYDNAGVNTLEHLSLEVFTLKDLLKYQDSTPASTFGSDVVLLIGLNEEIEILSSEALRKFCASSKAVVPLDCTGLSYTSLEKYGAYTPLDPLEPVKKVFDGIIRGQRFKNKALQSIVKDLWERRSSGDILFMALVLADAFADVSIKSVTSVTNTDSTSLSQLGCMVSNCREEIFDCLGDPECKAALDCLNGCKGNDQVCSYRCITSHETPKFEKFAMCILQKHNCMGNTATAPIYPDPQPMTTFRGEPLMHEAAEGIFVGHLEPRAGEDNKLMPAEAALAPWSWKVVCGQNPAYDYFSCQHQIFYFDKRSKSTMWYDPVFKVTTLAGDPVWRRRHYRVKRAANPGQFDFSVLDNGVTSNEFWRIVDCADDLSWAVFFYTGAAAAAGTSYSGALLVTKDGSWPEMSTDPGCAAGATALRIQTAMATGGIKMWELFEVPNDCCEGTEPGGAGPPPLGIK